VPAGVGSAGSAIDEKQLAGGRGGGLDRAARDPDEIGAQGWTGRGRGASKLLAQVEWLEARRAGLKEFGGESAARDGADDVLVDRVGSRGIVVIERVFGEDGVIHSSS
jgi:hypothetical protein